MKKEPYIPTQTEWVQQFGKPSLILPIKGRWLRKIWSGEKKEEFLEDTYIEGQDYQYMFASPDFNFSFAVSIRGGS